MVREDLIEGAITFLQDPSVASAPVDQKIAFLRSKNLTQEEIDASLARVGQPQTQPPQSNYSPQQQYPQQPQQYAYQQQQQPPPYWNQQPLEPPRRDWRDWFIVATVVGGVGYATYWTAKRYIYPLIAPPTPPQLEADKASIDASFDKAFALLDQLATNTQELKVSEKVRTERLDAALSDVEAVLEKLKQANEDREREGKGMARELSEVHEQIPKALEKERRNQDDRLQELTGEMKSLKTLVANRMQAPPAPTQQQQTGQRPMSSYASQQTPQTNGTSAPSAPASSTTDSSTSVNGSTTEIEKPASALPERSATSSPYGRMLGGKAQIPAWQMAAKKRNEEANGVEKDGSGTDGTSAPEPRPAEKVALFWRVLTVHWFASIPDYTHPSFPILFAFRIQA
ncbi:peroxisomal membrane protein pex14 [Recurvomyces mirabilis]|uniref:Peroxisomal membrane protein PEX14 n=1 Tax=Recurvomyces mirabilis TaxID=574656 RepID=A0AAE1C5T5_9PEZI|nr:peroxisomal membrane protein pex14 [Recurvomyces mirabilis]